MSPGILKWCDMVFRNHPQYVNQNDPRPRSVCRRVEGTTPVFLEHLIRWNVYLGASFLGFASPSKIVGFLSVPPFN